MMEQTARSQVTHRSQHPVAGPRPPVAPAGTGLQAPVRTAPDGSLPPAAGPRAGSEAFAVTDFRTAV